jgi:Fasciclin domain
MAPTGAVIALGRDFLDDLISSDQEALRELLLYHLFPGVVSSTGLSPGLLPTLSGTDTVIVDVAPMSFGGAEALSLDNTACNEGVYHTIGSVLDPAYQGKSSARFLYDSVI